MEAAKWICGDLARLENDGSFEFAQPALPPQELAALVRSLAQGELTGPAAKQVLALLATEGGTVQGAIAQLGLGRIDDLDAVRSEVRAVLEHEAKAVADLKAGKQQAMGFLVGQVMRRTRGRVAPDVARGLIADEVGI